MADPKASTCAACGAAGDLHEHHLVPRVCGGQALPTVMLCPSCHWIVHDVNISLNHVELIRLGLARRVGTKSGKPIGRAPVSHAKLAAIRAELAKGTGIIKAARLVGCGVGTVQLPGHKQKK